MCGAIRWLVVALKAVFLPEFLTKIYAEIKITRGDANLGSSLDSPYLCLNIDGT